MGDSSSSSSVDPTSESEEFLMIKEFIEDPDAVPKSREFLKEVLKEVITDPEVVSKCKEGLREVIRTLVISPVKEAIKTELISPVKEKFTSDVREQMKLAREDAVDKGERMVKEMKNFNSSFRIFSAQVGILSAISVMASGLFIFNCFKSSPRAAASAAAFLSRPDNKNLVTKVSDKI